MIIKYCPLCKGKPYTTNLYMSNCPVCSASLNSETVQSRGRIPGRTQLPSASSATGNAGNTGTSPLQNNSSNSNPTRATANPTYGNQSYPNSRETVSERTPVSSSTDLSRTRTRTYVPARNENPVSNIFNAIKEINIPAVPFSLGRKEVVSGRICKYSKSSKEDDKYRRLIFERLWHLFIYGQRCDDVLHRFSVASENKDGRGYTRSQEVPVNIYGIIAGGATIRDNDEVEVVGKYNRNNVLMARRVFIKNSGRPVEIKLQHSVKAITYTVLLTLAAIALIFTIIHIDGSFIDSVKRFFITWGIFSVIYLVLFAIATFSMGIVGFIIRALQKKRFPIFGVLTASFITSLIWLDIGGLRGMFMRGFSQGMGLFGGFIVAIILFVIIIRLLL